MRSKLYPADWAEISAALEEQLQTVQRDGGQAPEDEKPVYVAWAKHLTQIIAKIDAAELARPCNTGRNKLN